MGVKLAMLQLEYLRNEESDRRTVFCPLLPRCWGMLGSVCERSPNPIPSTAGHLRYEYVTRKSDVRHYFSVGKIYRKTNAAGR